MDETLINYYKILGVAPQADPEVIKQAFLDRARLLVSGYELLMHPQKRSQYDLSLGFADPDFSKEKSTSGENLSRAPVLSPEEAEIDSDEVKRLLDRLVVTLDGRVVQPQQKIERRLMSRLKVNKKLFLSSARRGGMEALLLDVSGGGARVTVSAQLEVGETLYASVDKDQPAFVLAQVVREIQSGEYGLKWLSIFEKNIPRGFLSSDKV